VPETTPLSIVQHLISAIGPRVDALAETQANHGARLDAQEKACAACQAAQIESRGRVWGAVSDALKQPASWGVIALALILLARDCGIDTTGLTAAPIPSETPHVASQP
jgi:hypothetical protein